ncbi:MAG: response regulator, partial [Bacteroidota bacterium]
IFDRFYQAPKQPYQAREGFGIGLALVKELVLLHGGTITVESEVGVGTTFSMVLPLNLDKETQDETEATPDTAKEPLEGLSLAINPALPLTKDKTILVVDDHEEIRSYLGSILGTEYNLLMAGNGQQALDLLAERSVDLILTDLMMPWLDGFGLLDELGRQDRFKNIPVMVVSARSTTVDHKKVLEAGVNDFIVKPFEAKDLKQRVNNRIRNVEVSKANAWQVIADKKDLLSNVEQSILQKINQLIMERIDDPNLTVDDLALEISVSRSKVFRLIKQLTQTTPKAYIKTLRLDYVHELMQKGKIKNASEGARAIGMLNGTEFKQQYQAKFGKIAFES